MRFFPISAGSMSAWMTFALGREELEVTGDPIVKSRAESNKQVGALQCIHRGTVPCIPGMPRFVRVLEPTASRIGP